MNRSPIVKRRALRDVAAMAKYLCHDDPDLGQRFLDAFDETARSLVEKPMGGVFETANPRFRNLRVWPVAGFPNHLIFYREIATGIEVI